MPAPPPEDKGRTDDRSRKRRIAARVGRALSSDVVIDTAVTGTAAAITLATGPLGGVSPKVVMEVLGHSEVGMTLNTYSRVIPQLRQEAAERMEEIFDLDR